MPSAGLLAVGLFVLVEIGVAVAWRPALVGPMLYEGYDLSYDYGYATDVPRLVREGDEYRFYPTEYVNIRAFGLPLAKPAHEIRIFTLGGSVSRGSGLEAGSDYSASVERMLNERHPEYRWRIVNLSADGFGTTRMLRILTNMAPHAPDALILHPHGTNEYEDERDARYRAQLRGGLNGLLLRSRLIVLLKKIESRELRVGGDLLPAVDDEETAERDPVNVGRWLETLEANIDRFDCVTDLLGIPSIYVGRAERDTGVGVTARVDLLNAPIQGERFYVDVRGAFTAADVENPDAALWWDDTHFSELGHSIVAEELFSMLRPGGTVFRRMEIGRDTPDVTARMVASTCSTLDSFEGAIAGGRS